jgi:hypothetical protein
VTLSILQKQEEAKKSETKDTATKPGGFAAIGEKASQLAPEEFRVLEESIAKGKFDMVLSRLIASLCSHSFFSQIRTTTNCN